MRSVSQAALFLARSATVGLAIAFVIVFLYPGFTGDANRSPDSYAAAVRSSSASVVNVQIDRHAPAPAAGLAGAKRQRRAAPRDPGGAPGAPGSNSLGSGVIVSPDGYILTNEHVIHGADRVEIGLRDGRHGGAKIIGVDPDTDLALLKTGLAGLDPIELGRSDTLAVGDVVLAIGDPYGVGQTVTQGIISAMGRSQLGLSTFEDFIQTDAAINPGNSGGALVDAQGRLVGINTAAYSPDGNFDGIGFAIPVNLARGVMRDLIKFGRVMRGWAGLDAQNLTRRLAKALGLADQQGIIIKGVQPGGPGDRAGIRVGDVVRTIDGQPVDSFREALNVIASLKPDTSINMTINRRGKRMKLHVMVSERPVHVES